ncbi:helix-turn-helix domain-containing protein [Microvirga roseola]|uniref:helix-turn-helix domain-containing protein n=1 Tax=Microvirga roseola TaxID=2883126 RepID=UPI001E639E24|nr:AraC family transcriptional regulator [Microvirga roseola]
MLSLPLPFVVALLLLILLVQMIERRNEGTGGSLFMVLLGIYALQSVLVGLRWSYGLTLILPLQSILAAILAAIAWLCFRELAPQENSRRLPAWAHGTPAAIVLALILLWPDWIDLALIAIFLGYGAALARLAWRGPDALSRVSFEGVVSTYGALWATAAALILSAILEVAVTLSIALGKDSYAALVVGIANLLALLILGSAAAVAGRSQPAPEPVSPPLDTPSATPDDEDVAIVAKLDAVMNAKRLFEDLDLNLERLARKTLIPGRRISTAINRVTGKNVSQYINDHRIAEACRLLAETEEPVTAIMFKAGFQTKSNFNREFRRVTGASPSAWRASRSPQGETHPGMEAVSAVPR